MMKCSVCGFEFEAAKEIHYIARVKGSKGFQIYLGKKNLFLTHLTVQNVAVKLPYKSGKENLKKLWKMRPTRPSRIEGVMESTYSNRENERRI